MKKIILILLAISLVSCGKVPQDTVDKAKMCMDSLKNLGAENSSEYIELQQKMIDADEYLERQKSMLFKKFGLAKLRYEEIIDQAHHFEITNDRKQTQTIIVPINSNTVNLEVQIDFDSPQNALEIANDIDNAIRHSVNTKAKLIRVNIVK